MFEPIADANISQYDLDFNGAQIEAISIIDAKTFWITSEETKNYKAFLAKLTIEWVPLTLQVI